jgi:hypothetical protein
MYEKKKVLLVVKAYPELSKKYGETVCTAGITEDGNWIRMYPIPMEFFRKPHNIPRYSWIEVECKKASGEKLNRKESFKIRPNTLRIIDCSLIQRPTNWKKRNEIILPLLNDSIEQLEEAFKNDGTSLGLIKPKEILEFYQTGEMRDYEEDIHLTIQKTIFGGEKLELERLPHMFRYKFICSSIKCKSHDMTCEDWELFQSFRSWRNKYPTHEELWEKIYQKFYTYFVNKCDLHFFMGTHSIYPVWMIIGLYYPKK